MWVNAGNTYSKVVRSTREEVEWLHEYLSFKSKAYRRGRPPVDEVTSLFDTFKETFPSGFVPLVVRAAEKKGFKVDVIDQRTPPCTVDKSADLAWLASRPYQQRAVTIGLEKTRGIFHMPTGSGKTEVAIGLVMRLPCRWLLLVHRKSLVEQAAERYELRTGLRADTIDEPGECNFTVATFQSMAAGLRRGDREIIGMLEDAEGLIIDECHTLPAASFWRVVMATKSAYYRFGLSGTPLARGDKRSQLAIAALGPVIYRVRAETLIASGVIARPLIHMIPCTQDVWHPTWQGVYGAAIVRSSVRNRLVVDAAKRAQKPCMVFVKEIKHGRMLVKALERSGLVVDFVYGKTEARNAAAKSLSRGDTDVMVASVVFQEGIDIPELRSVIIASGGKSVIATLQRVGRGMRVAEGKTTFHVWDFADRGNSMITRHARMRAKAYVTEGYETIIDNSFITT